MEFESLEDLETFDEEQPLREIQPAVKLDSEPETLRKRLLYLNAAYPNLPVKPDKNAKAIMALSDEDLQVCVTQAEAWLSTKVDPRLIQEYLYSLVLTFGGKENLGVKIANDGFLIGSLKQVIAYQLAVLPAWLRTIVIASMHVINARAGTPSSQLVPIEEEIVEKPKPKSKKRKKDEPSD